MVPEVHQCMSAPAPLGGISVHKGNALLHFCTTALNSTGTFEGREIGGWLLLILVFAHGAGFSIGSSTHILSGCFIRPASIPAPSPIPQKKSARTGPLMAPPVS